MNTKSIELLGFDTIHARITRHCRSEEGIQYLTDLPFLYTESELASRQALVGECITLLTIKGEGDLTTLPSIEAIMAALDEPAMGVGGRELVDLASYIEGGYTLFRFCSEPTEDGSPPLSTPLMGGEFDPRLLDLASSIREVLEESGEVKESHPALVALYRQIERSRSQRTSFCRSFITRNSHLIQADQEALRDGRLVIPIKREEHSSVKGFVSGVSSSGNTLFMEPFALVELNNAVMMAQNQIQVEIAKILAELTAEARQSKRGLASLRARVGHTDGFLTLARWVGHSNSSQVQLHTGTVHLIQARHPMLGDRAVPITLHLERGVKAVVLSGPNAGGKTVSIKTVGLFAMINQYVGYVPAHAGSSLPIFDNVFCDIGDEQSIDDELSTFSGHMKRISSILTEATPSSLILFDELGSGTDPVEGSAIAQSILEYAIEHASLTLVTSHHTMLKQFAWAKEEVINASMAFDESSLKPTFTITVGLPGESHGLDMAKQMGLPESVITAAERLLGSERLQLSGIIKDLEARRRELEGGERDLKKRRRTLQDEVRAVQLKELRLKQSQAALKREQVTELARFTRAKRSELEQLVGQLQQRTKLTRSETKEVKESLDALDQRLDQENEALATLTDEIETASHPAEVTEFEVGQSVLCGSARREGTILKREGKDRYLVAIDSMRMTLKASELTLMRSQERQPRVIYGASGPKPKQVLDVRGLTLEETLEQLAIQLEGALVHNMESFAIIHGYGDGILSRGVAEYLKAQPSVQDFRFALPEDGGMGKTYVILA